MIETSSVAFSEIQGIVRFGYAKLTEAAFHLLAVRDPVAARAWLAAAPVSTAEERASPPPTALQVAFTREGLQALGLPPAVLAGFSAEFLTGMSGDGARSRRLGDIGANAPDLWQWGGASTVPHLVVMLYAQPGHLETFTESIKGQHWDSAFRVLTVLSTSDLGGVEPFGFKDGISQPTVDWESRASTDGDQLDYRNLTAVGEFVLGYPNEYGKYTDRPFADSADPRSSVLPVAADNPLNRDYGRNGAYLVFRHLQQDVRGFWQLLDHAAQSDPAARAQLAA